MEQIEIWKSVGGDYDNYQVSNMGRLRQHQCNGIYKMINGTKEKEYVVISLSNGKQKKMDTSMHRLVLTTFSGVSEDKKKVQVNHKNGDKHDNRLENLEWMSGSENIKHAHENNLVKNLNGKKINLVDKDGNVIRTFLSSIEAGREMKCDSSSIIKVCKGKCKSVKGMLFQYAISPPENMEEKDVELIVIPGFSNYKISRCGNIYNKDGEKLSPQFDKKSKRLRVRIYDDQNKRHTPNVARLVALTFIPNPDGKANVQHIDGNPSNNNVENLRWVSNSETISDANKKRPAKVNSRSVHQIYNGKIVATFNSIKEAAEKIGVVRDAIDRCLRGYVNTSAGFEWKYADEVKEDGSAVTQLETHNEIVTLKTCPFVNRKGEICGSKIRSDNEMCSRHNRNKK